MRRTMLIAAVALACAVAATVTAAVTHGGATAAAAGPCQLGTKAGQIKHVIYLQFDNTHYNRDNKNVASDLEQMPNLLNFLKGNGTLLTNDHTILISHTAGGILSSLTGLYPDRNGQTVSNSYDYYRNDGTPTFASSFKYWTDTVDGSDDSLPNMVGDGQQTAPAPWLTYTHAGCNVGGEHCSRSIRGQPIGSCVHAGGIYRPRYHGCQHGRKLAEGIESARRHAGGT